MSVWELLGGKQGRIAQALFKANDAVLCGKGMTACFAYGDEKNDGHDNPPEKEVGVIRPVADGGGDSEGEIDEEHGRDEEVPQGIEPGVVFEVLRGGHRVVLSSGDGQGTRSKGENKDWIVQQCDWIQSVMRPGVKGTALIRGRGEPGESRFAAGTAEE